jgi:hypothetical protein
MRAAANAQAHKGRRVHLADSAAGNKPERLAAPASAEFLILAGTANRALAEAIAEHVGVPLGTCAIERFPEATRPGRRWLGPWRS